MAEQEKYLNLTAQCDDCVPPEGKFEGEVRAVVEPWGGPLTIEDTRSESRGTLVSKCLTHHKEKKNRHNHFKLLDSVGKEVGKCGLGAMVVTLMGRVEDIAQSS